MNEDDGPQPCEGCGALTSNWLDTGWFCAEACFELWLAAELSQPEFAPGDGSQVPDRP